LLSIRRPPSARLADRLEAGPHFIDEQLRLFPGGEVAALVGPVVVNELRISLLGPALRRLVDLIREGAYRPGDLQPPDIEEAARRNLRGVPVETRRGNRRIGQPVEGDVVEHVIR